MVPDVVLAATREGQPVRQSAAHVNGSCTAGELSTTASVRLRRRTLLVVLLFLLLLGNRSDTGRQREGAQRTPPGHLFPQLLLLVEQLRIHFYAPSSALVLAGLLPQLNHLLVPGAVGARVGPPVPAAVQFRLEAELFLVAPVRLQLVLHDGGHVTFFMLRPFSFDVVHQWFQFVGVCRLLLHPAAALDRDRLVRSVSDSGSGRKPSVSDTWWSFRFTATGRCSTLFRPCT
uniref:(northern house mosquito) hypothetical protein n=1 Tax=Culex pipiens TaxID=7175 RepID=A0A8D8MLG7_CULPI